MTIDWLALWQGVGAIGTGLGVLLVLALGIFTVFRQLPELRRARNAQIATDVYEEFRNPGAVKSLRRIYQLQDGTIPSDMQQEVDQVVDRFELLGALVATKAIDKEIALRLVRGQPLRCWYKLKRHVTQQRQAGYRGHYARHFEYYAHLSLKHQYEKVPPKEWTRLDGVDLVTALKDELLAGREPPK